MDLAKLHADSAYTDAPYIDTPDVDNLGIIVKCYTEVGVVQAMGKVEITARELISLDARHISHYVTVEVTPSSEYGHPGSAVIKYDDIPKVLRAVDALRVTNPQSTKFAHMEAEFSLEDFKLVVFNDINGKLMCSVNAGTAGAYFANLGKLDELKALLSRAKSVIDANRSQG